MPKKSRIPGGKQFYRRIINIKYRKFQKCTIKAQIALYVFRRSFFFNGHRSQIERGYRQIDNELGLQINDSGSLRIKFVVVQSRSRVRLFVTPWTAAHQASLSFTISQSWLKLVSMPSDHLILCCPLLFLLSIFPRIRVFSSESALYVRWPGYWTAGEFPSILKLITEGTVYV